MSSSRIAPWVSFACVAILALQNATLTSRLTTVEEQLAAVASAHESRLGFSGTTSGAASVGRRLAAVVADADALTHTASSGTNELAISSDQAVKVENARFAGSTIGLTADPDLITLASGAVTIAGTLTTSGKVIENGAVYFGAGVTGSADQSFAANSIIVFNTAQVNRGSAYSTSTGKFTAPVAGDYEFSWNLATSQTGTNCRADVFKNTGDTYYSLYSSQGFDVSTLTVLMTLAANDQVYLKTTTACSLRVGSSLVRSFASGRLLRQTA